MIDHGYYQSNVDFWLEKAIVDIQNKYGHSVSVHKKSDNLLKFGRSEAVSTTTKTTLMTLPSGVFNETYVTDNLITTVSSASALDTAANNASDIIITGCTVDGSGNFTFVEQTAALNGTAQITLTTPLSRADRIYNADSAEMTGPVYVYETGTATAGVPDTSAAVHLMLRGGEQQSEKCAVTIPSDEYWIVMGVYGDTLEKSAANAEIAFEVRLKGKVFRKQFDLSASEKTGSFRRSPPYIIIRPNSDVRMRALASGLNTQVSGGMFGTLLKII